MALLYIQYKVFGPSVLKLADCECYKSHRNAGIHKDGLKCLTYYYNGDYIGEIEWNSKTGQVGLYGRYQNICIMDELMELLQQKVLEENPNIVEISESGVCHEDTWVKYGGTFHKPLYTPEEFDEIVGNEGVIKFYQHGGGGKGGGYRIKMKK